MNVSVRRHLPSTLRANGLLPAALLAMLALAACGGGGDSGASADQPFQVGTTTFDPDLPPEPTLPHRRPGVRHARGHQQPGLAPRRRAAAGGRPLHAGRRRRGGSGEGQPGPGAHPGRARRLRLRGRTAVGAAIASADAAATAAQKAAALPNVNIAGASGEELAKPQYRAASSRCAWWSTRSGPGNGFITGPLTLPSGVTLWIDKGVTLYATRDVMAYSPQAGRPVLRQHRRQRHARPAARATACR